MSLKLIFIIVITNLLSVSLRDEIYDPYDPISSDSELEMPRAQHRNRSPVDQDNNLERHRLSPGRGSSKKCRWGSNYSESTGQPLNSRDLSPETRPTESRGLSPCHGLPERPGYDPAGRPLDHRVHSPDRPIHCSSSQCFPESYGGQRTNGEERMTIPEYRREVSLIRLKVWYLNLNIYAYSILRCRLKQDLFVVLCYWIAVMIFVTN